MVAATNLHNGTVIRKIVTDLHDDGQVIWATGLIDKCSVPAIAAIELTDDGSRTEILETQGRRNTLCHSEVSFRVGNN